MRISRFDAAATIGVIWEDLYKPPPRAMHYIRYYAELRGPEFLNFLRPRCNILSVFYGRFISIIPYSSDVRGIFFSKYEIMKVQQIFYLGNIAGP